MFDFEHIKRVINGLEFSYARPSQVRDIPRKEVSNWGYMPSLKKILKGYIWNYESTLERDFYTLLDQDLTCIDFQPQPFELEYTNKKGRVFKFYPDCWAIFLDKAGILRQFLFDVKTEHNWRNAMKKPKYQLRQEVIDRFCLQQGYTYQVITEKRIRESDSKI